MIHVHVWVIVGVEEDISLLESPKVYYYIKKES